MSENVAHAADVVALADMGSAIAAREKLTTRPERPGSGFAPAVAVPADAPAIDRLAGFLGRTVEG